MNEVAQRSFSGPEAEALTSIGAQLNATVAVLRISREVTNNIRFQGSVRELPSRAVLAGVVEDLRAALFPTHFGHVDLTEQSIDYFVGDTLDRALNALIEQVRRGLSLQEGANGDLQARAVAIVRSFAAELPEIRALPYSAIRALRCKPRDARPDRERSERAERDHRL